MPKTHERLPQEQETLMFSSPEAAQEWRQEVAEHLREQPPGIGRGRELVGQAVAKEFEALGQAVTIIRQPWEHTPAEHAEVQELVDVAFAQNLSKALTKAQKSQYYPRNVDLLHDVLTGELYEHVKTGHVNRQPLTIWFIEAGAIVLAALFGTLILLFFVR